MARNPPLFSHWALTAPTMPGPATGTAPQACRWKDWTAETDRLPGITPLFRQRIGRRHSSRAEKNAVIGGVAQNADEGDTRPLLIRSRPPADRDEPMPMLPGRAPRRAGRSAAVSRAPSIPQGVKHPCPARTPSAKATSESTPGGSDNNLRTTAPDPPPERRQGRGQDRFDLADDAFADIDFRHLHRSIGSYAHSRISNGRARNQIANHVATGIAISRQCLQHGADRP